MSDKKPQPKPKGDDEEVGKEPDPDKTIVKLPGQGSTGF